MAWTQAQLDALDAALATGALTVRDKDGTSITYRSLEAMRQLRAQMAASLASSPPPLVGHARPSKGL